MSGTAVVEAHFGGETRRFLLDIPRLEELQEKTDCGPEWLYERIVEGKHGGWRSHDIRHTLRLALIGGGMLPIEAAVAVDRYAGAGQLAEHKSLCAAIILAAILAPADEVDDPGEQTGEDAGSPAEKSPSAKSTKPPASSA